MKQFLISPPFGNFKWCQRQDCTPVLGSFTLEARPGLAYHTLRSFRRVQGGWINQIGLRNKGIRSITEFRTDVIYSLVGLEEGDWQRMWDICRPGITVEVNLGCPNVHEYGIPPSVLADYCAKFYVIAKLPPCLTLGEFSKLEEIAAMCIEAGVKFLHCSNTIPTPKGGISGHQLFEVNLPIVALLSRKYPGQIIAGGGIYHKDMIFMYSFAGASHFSLSTVWLTPWRVPGIIQYGKSYPYPVLARSP
jgi:dihydroorotate dehydrogenase